MFETSAQINCKLNSKSDISTQKSHILKSMVISFIKKKKRKKKYWALRKCGGGTEFFWADSITDFESSTEVIFQASVCVHGVDWLKLRSLSQHSKQQKQARIKSPGGAKVAEADKC